MILFNNILLFQRMKAKKIIFSCTQYTSKSGEFPSEKSFPCTPYNHILLHFALQPSKNHITALLVMHSSVQVEATTTCVTISACSNTHDMINSMSLPWVSYRANPLIYNTAVVDFGPLILPVVKKIYIIDVLSTC